jgi:hypothetical protein
MVGALLSFIWLPACLPLYMMGAKAAVTVASGVASEVSPKEPEPPNKATQILEAYKECLRYREIDPRVDCTRLPPRYPPDLEVEAE